MLDYIKLILQKVSFDRVLFEKELSKAVQKLSSHELVDLKNWCYTHFADSYLDILERFFASF